MMSPDEIEDYIQDLHEGVLEDEAYAKLMHELSTNATAREIYRDHLYLRMNLQFRSQARKHAGISDVVPIDRALKRQKLRVIRFAMAAAAAIVLCATIVSIFVILPKPPLARFEVTPDTQFTLTHSETRKRNAPEGLVLDIGTRLQMTQGTLEVTFRSGVRAMVRAPSDFTVKEADLLDFAFGTSWFEVPQKAVGFRVNTPELLVTDLGTEFGIVSSLSERDEVYVFSGKVQVVNHVQPETSTDLVANNARRANPNGSLDHIPFSTNPFFTELPQPVSYRQYIIDNGDFDSGYTSKGVKEQPHPEKDAYDGTQAFNRIAGDLSAKAMYTFRGLAPGRYKVLASWSMKGQYNADIMKVSVSDGGPTVNFNQRKIGPADNLVVNDGRKDINFELVGFVTVTDGKLVVTTSLGTGGDQNYFITDAIAVVQVPFSTELAPTESRP